jgi:hypothetical protein
MLPINTTQLAPRQASKSVLACPRIPVTLRKVENGGVAKEKNAAKSDHHRERQPQPRLQPLRPPAVGGRLRRLTAGRRDGPLIGHAA